MRTGAAPLLFSALFGDMQGKEKTLGMILGMWFHYEATFLRSIYKYILLNLLLYFYILSILIFLKICVVYGKKQV